MPQPAQLAVRLLGELEVARGSRRLELPQSKKTRALLAFLVVTGRSHRRERLCELLWDVTDDPRGALRWSLSRLRTLVNEPGTCRILADRSTVAFQPEEAAVDLSELRQSLARGTEAKPVQELEKLAAMFRGEFLEGLDLPDFHHFHSWCIAEREQARTEHAAILGALIARLSSRPRDALPYARVLVRIDPLNESAHANLVRLLAAAGKRAEAEQQHAASDRLLKELGAPRSKELEEARRLLVARPSSPIRAGAAISGAEAHPQWEPERPVQSSADHPAELVGRDADRERLRSALADVSARRLERILLLTGEPGIGKTRLASELVAEVRGLGGTVLEGRAYEAEQTRPYGPWTEALGCLPASSVGSTIGADLSVLLPELPYHDAHERSREQVFGAVVELIAARAHSAPPVLIFLDDMQWCDEASAALLHYASRMNRHRPVLVALAAREGELPDNGPVQRLLLNLRRDGLLEEIRLLPLSPDETARLARSLAPDADGHFAYSLSAGNPLFALEAARSLTRGHDMLPPTLSNLVRERIGGLPARALDVLRWCAVLGPTFSLPVIAELAGAGAEELVAALETLERHALLVGMAKPERGAEYAFAHGVVRQVVYADLSEPRRRLMHLQVARCLNGMSGRCEGLAEEIARHAALGGDGAMAARACVAAARRCLRVFANTEAEALARRGIYYAEQLSGAERPQRLLELVHIRIVARRPESRDKAIKEIEQLAELALDHGCFEHARLGFHMLGYLHWEQGEWPDAERHMLRAEQISRSSGDRERVVAMAEAARCLTLLERDLARAESLVMQAAALSATLDIRPAAIPDAEGMLRLHEGVLDEAALLFEQARLLARAEGNRLDEFHSLEHLVMVQLQRQDYARALQLSEELISLGTRLREGSEAPFARALAALSGRALGRAGACEDLERALGELRAADAKHRLAYLLTRAADGDLRAGEPRLARRRAAEALAIARALKRPSEIAMALAVLVHAASTLKDSKGRARHLAELRQHPLLGVSYAVRRAVETLLG